MNLNTIVDVKRPTGVRFAHLPFTADRIFDKLGVPA
jgi:hypothetical protein